MKAVALFSGGLDSILAVKLIMEQGIEVVALHFSSPFCTCNNKGCGVTAFTTAQTLNVELVNRYLGEEYMAMVKHPKFGYGKNLNPCIDCRILLLKKAKDIMHEIGASFVITGEVVGQRPKSQHKISLKTVEIESGLEGLIVRPLSAKLLDPTIPEQNGWVKREKLLNFNGRSRRPQMDLAHSFGIHDYPCPAGGCLLTDPEFVKRARDLMARDEFNLKNAELLKVGRHFRLGADVKLIVGRDEKENERLQSLAQEKDYLFYPVELAGPTALGKGYFDEGLIELSCGIVSRYCDLEGKPSAEIGYKRSPDTEEKRLLAGPVEECIIENSRI